MVCEHIKRVLSLLAHEFHFAITWMMPSVGISKARFLKEASSLLVTMRTGPSTLGSCHDILSVSSLITLSPRPDSPPRSIIKKLPSIQVLCLRMLIVTSPERKDSKYPDGIKENVGMTVTLSNTSLFSYTSEYVQLHRERWANFQNRAPIATVGFE